MPALQRFDPRQPRDGEGQWTGRGGGALPDALNLAGKVHLADGERLAGSGKVSGESGRALLAVIDRDGSRSVRLGLGSGIYGTRDDDAGPWRAGPDPTAEVNRDRQAQREQRDAAERDLAALAGTPDADPATVARLQQRLDAFDDADLDDVPAHGYTAQLTAEHAGRLRDVLAGALQAGARRQRDLDARFDRLEALERERQALKHLGRTWTDEEDARWDAIDAEITALRTGDTFTVLAAGVVPGEWADVHYEVSIDDPTVGVEVRLGAVPHHPDASLDALRDADAAAWFDAADTQKVIRQLDAAAGAPAAGAPAAGAPASRSRTAHRSGLLVRQRQPPPAEHTAPIRPAPKEDAMGLLYRTFALDDIAIVRAGQGGDGRTVEAYCALFDAPYEVKDQYGHYEEDIARAAFNRTLNGAGARAAACLYNHGMTLDGKPNIIAQVPLGTPLKIEPDGRGLLTITRYNRSELADATLEAIRNGDIKSQSFQGPVYRSSPNGAVPRTRPGQPLPRVTRLELGLRDYGPTPIPVNDSPMMLAVRSAVDIAAEIAGLTEAERADLIRALAPATPADGTPAGVDPEATTATPTESGPGAEDPPAPVGHSGRLTVARARLRMELIARGVRPRG